MRKLIAILISTVLLVSLCAVSASAEDAVMQIVSCPEQEFSTLCDPAYSWKYTDRDGITIYTDREGSIPYVLVFRSEDLIAEPADYIREQYTPHMQAQYGDDLVSSVEYGEYTIGGRPVAAALYTYRLQGYLIDMLRAYDMQNGHTVVYTAKYIQGQGDATLEALETAVAGYRADADYYSSDYPGRDWRYITTADSEGNMIFIFDEVFVAVPADWAGKYDVVINERGVSFYHSLSRWGWEREDIPGGLLFSLCRSETEDYRNLPSYSEVGPGINENYYLVFPSDYQAYAEIDAIRAEYDALWSEIDFVKDNSYSFIFHTQPVG